MGKKEAKRAKLVIDKADAKQPRWEKRNWLDPASPNGYRIAFVGTGVRGPTENLDLDPWVSEPYCTFEVSTNTGLVEFYLDPKQLKEVAGLLNRADEDMQRETVRSKLLRKKYNIKGL